MKKVLLTVVAITTLGLGNVVSAQDTLSTKVEQTTVAEKFAKIEVSALPAAVTEAVAKDYKGSTIKEAFEKKKAKLYKVVITVSEAKEETVIYNETGKVHKDAVK